MLSVAPNANTIPVALHYTQQSNKAFSVTQKCIKIEKQQQQ